MNGPSSAIPARNAPTDSDDARVERAAARRARARAARAAATARRSSAPGRPRRSRPVDDETSAGTTNGTRAPRRVLDAEVAIRHVAVRDPLAVVLVDGRVEIPGPPSRRATKRPTSSAAHAATIARNAVAESRGSGAPPTARVGRAPAPSSRTGCGSRRGSSSASRTNGQEPRDVEVRPVRQRRARSRRARRRSARRARAGPFAAGSPRRRRRARARATCRIDLHGLQVRDPARVVLAPVPGRERRVAVELVAERAVDERRAPPCVRLGSSRRIENTASVATTKPTANLSRGARAEAVRIREPERREQERGELRPARERDRRTPGDRRRAEPEAPHEDRGHDRVVRVRVHRVGGEREREPAEGERDRERLCRRSAGRRGTGRARRAGRRRSRSRARPEASPTCPTRSSEHGRDVGEVGDRAVGVAARVRGLAAAVRLDAVADLAVGVGRAAGAAASSTGMCPYGASPSRIRSAPITPA